MAERANSKSLTPFAKARTGSGWRYNFGMTLQWGCQRNENDREVGDSGKSLSAGEEETALRLEPGNPKNGESDPLQAQFPARWIVPFLKGVRASTPSSGANRNGRNSER